MNDRFYTNELSEIRSFCNHSDKEDIYMYISSLQQENQRLKEELKYTVPIVEHNKIVSKKLKENQELKKQLEQYQEEVCILDMITDENIKYKNQQKEFIEYLEEQIKDMEEEIGNSITKPYEESHIIRKNVYQEILSKYKEIIGGKE